MIKTDVSEYVRQHVRTVPDFPKKGIMFLDITTATKDAKAMQYMTDILNQKFKNQRNDYVAGIETTALILGAALAYKRNARFTAKILLRCMKMLLNPVTGF